MARVIAFAIELAGCPIAVGGARNLLAAFERLIVDQGGAVRTGAEVARILRSANGRAAGVKLADGETILATRGVICSTTPNQLYKSLLKDWPTPPPRAVADGLKRYRYGKGDMQMHYALSAPPRWKGDPDLAKVALLHLTSGLDGVSRASNECERGLLPAEPTICVGQPTALDSSRAPPGAAILWLQAPEAPRVVKGDAAGEIPCPADGAWTEALREAYADRIERRLAAHIENFGRNQARATLLFAGRPRGDQRQSRRRRPLRRLLRPRPVLRLAAVPAQASTIARHIPGLYHIGASTHPGPGLAGGSGFLLASSLN